MIDIGQQKEQFSRAYVLAVATAGGFNTYGFAIDDDSIDIGIATRTPQGGTDKTGPRVELQLKCTSVPHWVNDDLHYNLKLKNYNDLRGESTVPRILVVLIVPDDLLKWVAHSEDEMAVRKCAYWTSLRTEPLTTNTSSVTVKLPRRQQFSVESLARIMSDIAGGTMP